MNKKQYQKSSMKAQIHVEMIVSFVIFVGFLLALLFFLNPVGRETLSFSSLDKVQDKVVNNISVNYKSATFILTNAPTENKCLKDFSNPILSENLVAFSSTGIKVPADYNKPTTKIQLKPLVGERAYRLYSFEGFQQETSGLNDCKTLSNFDYSFGLIENSRAVFQGNLNAFNKSYIENYLLFKQKLGIEKDFDFVVYNETRGVLYDDNLRIHRVRADNVLSRDIPLTMINSQGQKIKIILNLRVW